MASDDQELLNFLNSDRSRNAVEKAGRSITEAAQLLVDAVNRHTEQVRPASIDEPVPPVGLNATTTFKMQNAQRVLTSMMKLPAATELSELPNRLVGRLEAIEEYVDTWNRLHPELAEVQRSLHPEVRGFVEAASSQEGAPLSLLTESVLAYLRENEALSDFVVRNT